MELSKINGIALNNCIHLCKKCLEKDKYIIPLDHLNESNEIEYKCSQKHKIGEEDICFKELNEKIITSLNKCNDEHHEYDIGRSTNFCGWCNTCCKNICEIGVGYDLKAKHDYLLFAMILDRDTSLLEPILKEKLNQLENLIKNYKNICPLSKDEINYLTKVYNRNYINYNLFYNKKIFNYQIIYNIFIFQDNLNKNFFELYEGILKYKRYKFFSEEFFNKIPKVNMTKIGINLKLSERELFKPFIKKSEKIGEKETIYFAIYNPGQNLRICDLSGEVISNISLASRYIYDNDELIWYKENILIIFNIIEVSIIYLKEDFSLKKLDSLFIGVNQKDDIYLYFDYSMAKHKKSNNIKEKIIKTSANNFLVFYKGAIYSLFLNTFIDENVNSSLNFQTINLPKFNKDGALFSNSACYKRNNRILEGIIYVYITNILGLMAPKIKLLDENLNQILEIGFKYNDYKKKNLNIFGLTYNYYNNFILLFINQEIYQFNSLTKEVVTIYDAYHHIYSKIKDDNLQNILLMDFYDYDKNNNKVEQIILINNKSRKKYFKFNWNEKMIKLKKKYSFPYLIMLIPLINYETLNYIENDEKTLEKFDVKILIIENNYVLAFD